jgi:hypothetical protein
MKWFRRRFRPSPAIVVAFMALVIALGGTSYAALKLPAKSVGAKQLKRSSVTSIAIAAGAVDGSKVKDDSLTGADINESSVAKVPSAGNADNAANAANAAHANSAAALDKVTYRTVGVSAVPAPDATTASVTPGTAGCDSGQHVVGGGVRLDDTATTAIVDSYPDAGGTAWTVHIDNGDNLAAHGFTVYAVCVTSATVG